MANFTPSNLTSPVQLTATAGIMSVPEIAGQAETVVKNIMRVEPMLAGMAGMFVPGLSLVQPWIILIAPYLERALDELSKSNNGDALGAVLELIQHITTGQPNNDLLGPDPTVSSTVSGESDSAKGSG